MKRWLIAKIFILIVLAGLSLLAYGYYEATQDPIARKTIIKVDDWPINKPPMRVLLMADIQMAGPDMTPDRLDRIVTQINKENADIILIAGDFISKNRLATKLYTADETIAPLAKLKASVGIYAVLGNHDHWTDKDGFIKALDKYNITLLSNEAVAVDGINIVGIDDEYTKHADIEATMASLSKLEKTANIVVTHDPDIIPEIPFDTAMIGAGHTHCGQISPPLIGPLTTLSRYGRRFACGEIDDNNKKVIVSAGLGTSILPLRIGAPPDYWVITLVGKIGKD